MSITLTTKMLSDGDIQLTAEDGAIVGWIKYNTKTGRFEPLMLGAGCADCTTFRSREAAEFQALAHHAEAAAVVDVAA